MTSPLPAFEVNGKLFYSILVLTFLGVCYGTVSDALDMDVMGLFSDLFITFIIVLILILTLNKLVTPQVGLGVLLFSITTNFILLSLIQIHTNPIEGNYYIAILIGLAFLGIMGITMSRLATWILGAILMFYCAFVAFIVRSPFMLANVINIMLIIVGVTMVMISYRGQLLSLFRQLAAQHETAQKALDELKRTQKQVLIQEKMASLGALTAGIAHELKNPLNLTLNFSDSSKDLLEEMSSKILSHLDPSLPRTEIEYILNELTQNMKDIRAQSDRADQIVKGMLLHSGQWESEPEEIPAPQLLQEAYQLSWMSYRAKNPHFTCERIFIFDSDLPPLFVRKAEMMRALVNIFKNSFQAMSQTPEKSVLIMRTKPDLYGIRIEIEDNGVGIPTENLDQVLMPFYTTLSPGDGVGLGLSIAYEIITSGHGGTLEISSRTQTPSGTRVEIFLPRRENESPHRG